MPASPDAKEAAGAAVSTLSAQAALLQPIHRLILATAAAAIGVMSVAGRMERIENSLQTLTTIVCADKPNDSHCQRLRQ